MLRKESISRLATPQTHGVIVATHQFQPQTGHGAFRDLLPALHPPYQVSGIPRMTRCCSNTFKERAKKKPTPPKELVQLLTTYSFPGNVRELRVWFTTRSASIATIYFRWNHSSVIKFGIGQRSGIARNRTLHRHRTPMTFAAAVTEAEAGQPGNTHACSVLQSALCRD
jgi:hypothetical protein